MYVARFDGPPTSLVFRQRNPDYWANGRSLILVRLTKAPRESVNASAVAAPEAIAAAREANLRYVSDESPGITRRNNGKNATYLDPNGRAVKDGETLGRIKRLAIPPAWTDVWICPLANGHIQATGRDARGRKQYRYHSDW